MLNTLDTTADAAMVIPPKRTEEQRRMEIWLRDKIAASKKEPSAEIVTLTPVLAGLLLERNPVNRPISKMNSADLAGDIRNKRFVFNGESIVVSNLGTLIDGQHRCQQVVETGVSVRTVLVFGPKEDARYTIDTGRPKTVGNFLAMKGRRYSHVLGPAVSYVLQHREHGKLVIHAPGLRPTKATILEAADDLSGIDESVDFTAPSVNTIRSHALLAFCHFVFKRKAGATAANEFISKLISGEELRKGDAIHYCRNKLLSFGRLTDAATRAELVFKCWNAWRNGGHVVNFRLTGGKLPKLEG